MNKIPYSQSLFIVFIVTLLLAQFNVTAVTACTATPPSMGPPPTVADRVKSADIVLLGTVKNVINPQDFEETAVVQVERYFKGSGESQIQILGFGSSAICRSQVSVEDRLVFYVQQQANGSLYAHWLTAGGAIASPTDDLIAEITTVLDLPPTANINSPLPSADETATPEAVAIAPSEPPPTKASSSPIFAGIGVLLLLILITAVIIYRHRTKGTN